MDGSYDTVLWVVEENRDTVGRPYSNCNSW